MGPELQGRKEIFNFWAAVVPFLYIDILDATGTLCSMAKFAGMTDDGGNFEGQYFVFMSDATSIVVGSLLGTSPMTKFIMSATVTNRHNGASLLLRGVLLHAADHVDPSLGCGTATDASRGSDDEVCSGDRVGRHAAADPGLCDNDSDAANTPSPTGSSSWDRDVRVPRFQGLDGGCPEEGVIPELDGRRNRAGERGRPCG